MQVRKVSSCSFAPLFCNVLQIFFPTFSSNHPSSSGDIFLTVLVMRKFLAILGLHQTANTSKKRQDRTRINMSAEHAVTTKWNAVIRQVKMSVQLPRKNPPKSPRVQERLRRYSDRMIASCKDLAAECAVSCKCFEKNHNDVCLRTEDLEVQSPLGRWLRAFPSSLRSTAVTGTFESSPVDGMGVCGCVCYVS